MDMKCTACGCRELIPVEYITADVEGGLPTLKAYACVECRHVELYADEGMVRAYLRNSEKERLDREAEELRVTLRAIDVMMDRCRRTIAEGDPTAMASAEARLVELREEKDGIEERLREIGYRGLGERGSRTGFAPGCRPSSAPSPTARWHRRSCGTSPTLRRR